MDWDKFFLVLWLIWTAVTIAALIAVVLRLGPPQLAGFSSLPFHQASVLTSAPRLGGAPEEARDEFFALFTDGKVPVEEISRRLVLPVDKVAFVMTRHWPKVLDALNGID